MAAAGSLGVLADDRAKSSEVIKTGRLCSELVRPGLFRLCDSVQSTTCVVAYFEDLRK
jgi:hypothetical protein